MCNGCQAGKYQPYYAKDACLPCVKGHFCPFSASALQKCGGVALYCPDSSSTVKVVELGYYSTSGGISDGSGDVLARDAILPCPPGYYCAGGLRKVCESSTFQQLTNSTTCNSCSPCPPGKYVSLQCTTTTDSQCSDCPAGTYASSGRAKIADCIACAAVGSYSSTSGSAYCSTAGAGKYANSLKTAEVQCSSGTFSVGGVDACMACASGSYSAAGAVGCTTCTTCFAGSYETAACTTTSDRTCAACPAGKSGAGGTVTACTDCVSGKYSSEGSSHCFTAEAGSRALKDRTGSALCPPNTFSIGAVDDCTSCGNGHSPTGSASCIECRPGKYYDASDFTVLDQCFDCPPGRYSEFGSQTKEGCLACNDAGKYSSSGAAYCSTVKAGYAAFPDRTGFSVCPSNTFSIGAVDDCLSCGNGHSAAGSSSCISCSPGKYYEPTADPTLASDQCLPCPAGKFAKDGAVSISGCAVCAAVGSYSSDGAAHCSIVGAGFKALEDRTGTEVCPKNTFSVGAADECKLCPEEAHSASGSYKCDVCSTGTYFDESLNDCVACEAGTYTVSGARSRDGCLKCSSGFISGSQAGYCEPCPAGSYASLDHTSCVACIPGKYSGIASAECSDCEVGKFGKFDDKRNQVACFFCPENQISGAGRTECTCDEDSGFVGARTGNSELKCLCPPGKTYENHQCSNCPSGYFKNVTGNVDCVSCGKRAVLGAVFSSQPATSPYNCSCSKGDFRLLHEVEFHPYLIGECRACPEGADCSSSGITLELLPLKKGYWRNSGNSFKVVQCYTAEACPQNKADSSEQLELVNVDDQCREGHEGPICNVCVDGYVKSVLGLCDVCEDTAIPTNFVIVIVVVTIGSVLTIAAYVRRHRRLKNEQHERTRTRTLNQSSSSDEIDEKRSTSLSERLHAIRKDDKSWFQKFRTKFKILVSFYQISSQFESVLNIRFPPVFENFGRMVSSIANLDALNVAKVGCLVKTDFYTKLLVSTLGPLSVTAVLFLGATFLYLMAKSKDSKTAIVDAAMSLFLALTYMVFASVSTTVFDTFNCQTFGDDETSYMSNDQSINCDDPTHRKYQGFAYVMIAFYPVGIPLLYFFCLFRSRKALREEDRVSDASLTKISFLWDMYVPELWWFEVFDCFRRLSLTGLLIFVFRGRASQIVFAMVMASFSVVSFVHLKPYL